MRYNWEFAERGNIEAHGVDGLDIIIEFAVGEYTTFIDAKTQMKKHVLANIDVKKIKNFLAEKNKEYISPFWETKFKKVRSILIKEKFIKKLNKKNLIIIDRDWLK